MSIISFKNKALWGVLTFSALSLLGSPVSAQIDMAQQPVLVITNKTVAPTNVAPIYSRPTRAPEISQQQVADAAFNGMGSTMVGGKIEGLSQELFALQSNIGRLSDRLSAISNQGKNIAAGYYANVATINTALQTGTTPGNPRLVQNLDAAQANLDTLSNNVAELNALGVEIADAASKSTFLLNNIRSTFNLTGAVEEDHARLAQLEDQANTSMVAIDRLLNEVNDDMSRITAYLNTERNNMRTLALAVSNGDLYGGSLANNPFSRAPRSQLFQQSSFTPSAPAPAPMMAPAAIQPSAPAMPTPTMSDRGFISPRVPLDNAGPSNMTGPSSLGMATPPAMNVPMASPAVTAPVPTRPLAKIRFDKPNVDYEQPIYNAVQNAMARYPNGRFELIAVHPTSGNAAMTAIESTRSRRNAERVLRTLTQMGVSLDQIDLSYAPSAEAQSSEVHLFLR